MILLRAQAILLTLVLLTPIAFSSIANLEIAGEGYKLYENPMEEKPGEETEKQSKEGKEGKEGADEVEEFTVPGFHDLGAHQISDLAYFARAKSFANYANEVPTPPPEHA